MRISRFGIVAAALLVLVGLAPAPAFAQQELAEQELAQQEQAPQAQDQGRAEASEAERIEQPARTELPAPNTPPQVRWSDNWEKVRWWQYPASVSLMAFGFTSRFALPDPEPNWRGTVGVDQGLLDLIAVREDPARQNLLKVTDLTFFGSMAYRVFDSVVVPGLWHDNWEAAWQMSWIDFQAFSVVAGVLWGSQLFIGRVRPTSNNCDDPERTGHLCNPENSDYARSFIAGHPATAITAAGLTCLHHEHMPLYGGGVADDLACGVMIGNAVIGGVTRVMTESHYPSDLLFGTVLGLTAGWVLPSALHYGWDDEEDAAETARLPDEEPDPSAPVFTLAPGMMDNQPSLMMMGRF